MKVGLYKIHVELSAYYAVPGVLYSTAGLFVDPDKADERSLPSRLNPVGQVSVSPGVGIVMFEASAKKRENQSRFPPPSFGQGFLGATVYAGRGPTLGTYAGAAYTGIIGASLTRNGQGEPGVRATLPIPLMIIPMGLLPTFAGISVGLGVEGKPLEPLVSRWMPPLERFIDRVEAKWDKGIAAVKSGAQACLGLRRRPPEGKGPSPTKDCS
ncbi:MAG: hypothetical protein AAFU77_14105 [Myxococcota bacterium]